MQNDGLTFDEFQKKYFNLVYCPRCHGETEIPSAIFPHLHVKCPACGGKGWVKDNPDSLCNDCDIENPSCDRCLGS